MKTIFATVVILLISISAFTQENSCYHAIGFKHDNDINFFTDQYFTSGIEIQWYSPILKRSPINKILFPDRDEKLIVYALTITHHMYTPKDLFTPDITPDDHPYAAYLLIGQVKESYDLRRKLKKTSAFQVGWIGPQAGGAVIQNTLHDHISIADPVEGWDNQIQRDICLQYSAQYEYGLFVHDYFELITNLKLELGIPRTQGIGGLKLRTGIFTPYFLGPETLGIWPWQIWGFTEANLYIVNYNAVLQGGFFNHNNRHVLNNVNRTYGHFRYGATLVYHTFSLKYAVNINSPTFATALWHHWSEMTLVFAF